VALTGFMVLSLITFGINVFFFGIEVSLFALFVIILVSGILTTILMCGTGLFVAYVVVRKKLDPDNFTPPIITTLGDAVGTLLLVFLIRMILLA
ncbi:MAG: magnesium transporter, partial [Promethearchaeota archaeon]